MHKISFATKQSIQGIIFVIPCMVVIICMMLYPLVQTFVFSFSTITLPKFDLKFAGLNNFSRVFSRPEMPLIVRNTLVWTIGTIILRLTMGMMTALIMNAKVRGIAFLRVLALIPWTIPSIVSANSWRWIFQGDFGVLNGMLKSLGLNNLAYTWLGNTETAMGAVLTAASWAGYPFVMMMFLAAMQGLPREHFEAAMIDGANSFQRFLHIIIPGIKPVLLIVLALETINAINAFDMIFTMTGGGPANATLIFGLFIYRLGFTSLDFASASTVSVLLIVTALFFIVIYIVLQGKSGKKGVTIR